MAQIHTLQPCIYLHCRLCVRSLFCFKDISENCQNEFCCEEQSESSCLHRASIRLVAMSGLAVARADAPPLPKKRVSRTEFGSELGQGESKPAATTGTNEEQLDFSIAINKMQSSLRLQSSSTLADLQAWIFKQSDIPIANQKVFFRGKRIDKPGTMAADQDLGSYPPFQTFRKKKANQPLKIKVIGTSVKGLSDITGAVAASQAKAQVRFFLQNCASSGSH